MPAVKCILCGGGNAKTLYMDRAPERTYFRCGTCALSFLDPARFLPSAEEHHRYLQHKNDPADPGYRKFLNPLLVLIQAQNGRDILDFGCGAGAPVKAWLEPQGFNVRLFDPFFFPQPENLERVYDFVAASEVAEHLQDPAKEFARLRALLKPGGRLGLMTELCDLDSDFGSWYYRRDPTHVAFYARETLQWISKTYLFTDLRIHSPRLAEFFG
jgi:2-polyprenyl-3-methyl-5-hydroxy-6-metoxy-1,4-benzoquinol methylase